MARPDVPQADLATEPRSPTRGGHALPIRMEGDAGDRAGVAAIDHHLLPGGEVPDPHARVEAAGREFPAVRAEGQAFDGLGMTVEDRDESSRSRPPRPGSSRPRSLPPTRNRPSGLKAPIRLPSDDVQGTDRGAGRTSSGARSIACHPASRARPTPGRSRPTPGRCRLWFSMR